MKRRGSIYRPFLGDYIHWGNDNVSNDNNDKASGVEAAGAKACLERLLRSLGDTRGAGEVLGQRGNKGGKGPGAVQGGAASWPAGPHEPD